MRLFQSCFAFALLCAAQTLAASVDGRVVNSSTNESVPQAELTLTCLIDTSNSPNVSRRLPCKDASGRTQADGTFHFELPYGGRYRLRAAGAPGLVPTRSAQVELNLDYKHSLNDLVLKLAPEATITGKVFDETGQPKAGVTVEALRVAASGAKAELRGVSRALSHADGVYVLRGLVSGNYYISTPLHHEDKNDTVHPYLFFAPDALGLDQAALTHVDLGQNYSGVEIHLRPVVYFRIQGRAQMETTGALATDQLQLHLDARDNSGVLLPGRDILLNPDGAFQTEVLPGAYTLRLTGAVLTPQPKNSPRPPVPIVHLLAKQDIEVSAKDLLGVMLLIPPPITVTGHATLVSTTETNLGKGRIVIRPTESFALGGPQSAEIQPDGTFVLTNCDPAHYAVHIFPPSGTFVKSIVFNQQDITAQLMDLSRGDGGELTVIVRQGSASLTGTVPESSSSPDGSESHTSFDVVLIPELWDPNGLFPIRHAAANNGHFVAANLPPGHYSVVATTGIEGALWNNAQFVHEMQARGAAVDLAENDQKQVTPPYVTFEEIDQIQARLGID